MVRNGLLFFNFSKSERLVTILENLLTMENMDAILYIFSRKRWIEEIYSLPMLEKRIKKAAALYDQETDQEATIWILKILFCWKLNHIKPIHFVQFRYSRFRLVSWSFERRERKYKMEIPNTPPPKEGMVWICTPYVTRGGKRHYASSYGLKAFCFWAYPRGNR